MYTTRLDLGQGRFLSCIPSFNKQNKDRDGYGCCKLTSLYWGGHPQTMRTYSVFISDFWILLDLGIGYPYNSCNSWAHPTMSVHSCMINAFRENNQPVDPVVEWWHVSVDDWKFKDRDDWFQKVPKLHCLSLKSRLDIVCFSSIVFGPFGADIAISYRF